MSGEQSRTIPTRRKPPRFRPVVVAGVVDVGPRLRRLTLAGPELDGLTVDEPAASVRLLLPRRDTGEVELPEWNGNEWLHADGSRPSIRTLTPRYLRPEANELDVDVVLHDGGALSSFAAAAAGGEATAISGTGRGHDIDEAAARYVLAGDEAALPAISQLLEAMPEPIEVHVAIELSGPDGEIDLPAHPSASVGWHVLDDGADPGAALLPAVRALPIDADTRVWVAGEAAAVHKVRGHVFDELGLPRRGNSIRGYWKHGREGT